MRVHIVAASFVMLIGCPAGPTLRTPAAVPVTAKLRLLVASGRGHGETELGRRRQEICVHV